MSWILNRIVFSKKDTDSISTHNWEYSRSYRQSFHRIREYKCSHCSIVLEIWGALNAKNAKVVCSETFLIRKSENIFTTSSFSKVVESCDEIIMDRAMR